MFYLEISVAYSKSLKAKLIISIAGSLSLLLIATGIWQARTYTSNVQSKISAEITELISIKAEEVKSFFVERGRVSTVFLSDPRVVNWLKQHNVRGSELSNDEQYQQIHSAFNTIVDADSTIKSIFFGSAKTFEYFYEQGRVGVALSGDEAGDVTKGYFTNKRPWWHEAVAKNKLYLTSPQVDATDKTVSSVLQMPIKTKSNELLGIGGVDILIGTVGELVNEIRYQNQGAGFLLNENQQVVYFAGDNGKLELNQNLSEFDSVYSESSGFNELSRLLQRNQKLAGHSVTWNSKEYLVFSVPVNSQVPDFSWTLGLLIPIEVVSTPAIQAMFWAIGIIFAIVIAVTMITIFVARQITNPIVSVANSMEEIAQGEGDLTKRLKVDSNDEVGELASQFNQFIDKIQVLIKHASTASDRVVDTADRVSSTASELNQEMIHEQSQMQTVAHSVSSMKEASQDIDQLTSQAVEVVDNVSKSVQLVSENSKKTQTVISEISKAIENATRSVMNLNSDVEQIGAVLDVIKTIAEQTNLLALNAAIEAARAGEQGRGFAVVADEVRVLATRTQESTNHIQQTVEKLQSGAKEAQLAMELSNTVSSKGVDQMNTVMSEIDSIHNSMRQVSQLNFNISESTSQQNKVSSEVEHSLESINRLIQKMVEHAGLMDADSHTLNDIASELLEIVRQFKVN